MPWRGGSLGWSIIPAAGKIPGQDVYGRQLINVSHIDVSISVSPFLSL